MFVIGYMLYKQKTTMMWFICLFTQMVTHVFLTVKLLLNVNCNRANEMCDVQIRLQALFQDLVKNTGRVKTSANRYNTDKTKINPMVNVSNNHVNQ